MKYGLCTVSELRAHEVEAHATTRSQRGLTRSVHKRTCGQVMCKCLNNDGKYGTDTDKHIELQKIQTDTMAFLNNLL